MKEKLPRLRLHKTDWTEGGNPKSRLPRFSFHGPHELRSAIAEYCRRRNAKRAHGALKTTESSACRELIAEALEINGIRVDNFT